MLFGFMFSPEFFDELPLPVHLYGYKLGRSDHDTFAVESYDIRFTKEIDVVFA